MPISVQQILSSNLPVGFTGSQGPAGAAGAIGYVGSAGASGAVRMVTYADASPLTVNTDTTDMASTVYTGASGTYVINNPVGTISDGQKLIIRIQATNSQTLTFGTAFDGSTDLPLPTTLSGGSKIDYLGFMYSNTQLKWNLVAKNFGF